VDACIISDADIHVFFNGLLSSVLRFLFIDPIRFPQDSINICFGHCQLFHFFSGSSGIPGMPFSLRTAAPHTRREGFLWSAIFSGPVHQMLSLPP
jgi:hypothetical protein